MSVYKGCEIKVDIICPMHGIFKQSPSKHMTGRGCPRCARELEKYNALTTESFIAKAKIVHGDIYDYSQVDYRKSCIKVKIGCPKHGIFEQTPNNHIMGMKCIKCANEENGIKRRSNAEEFIIKAKKIHGEKYDYSMVEYINSQVKVKIMCPLHGSFLQAPSSHLNNRGCPMCQESRGERKIALFLKSHGIEYERQRTFDRCKNIRNLFFDFYVPTLNTCIEYDGRQHFFPSDYFGGISAFKYLKKADYIKNKFCSDSGINLIRIPYSKKVHEIISILEKELLGRGHENRLSIHGNCRLVPSVVT